MPNDPVEPQKPVDDGFAGLVALLEASEPKPEACPKCGSSDFDRITVVPVYSIP